MSRRRDEERERLLVTVSVLEDQIERLADLLADSHGKFDELLEAHRTLLETHRELQAKHEVAAQAAMPAFSNQPLYISEEEEDAAFADTQGAIDTELYKGILDAAGFPNTQVEVQPS